MRDTDRSDVIPGLRSDDTPPMPQLLPGVHRRRRRDVPWWAWVAIWGAPAAVLAGLVGWSLGGPSDHRPPAAVVSSPTKSTPAAEAPVSLPPTTTAKPQRRSVTHSAPAPSPTTKATHRPSPTVTPSPTRTRTRTGSPAPSPTRTHESPSPAPTDSHAPPTFTPPTITPEATHGR